MGKPAVLVVDDEDDFRDVLKDYLEFETDCCIETARNGKEALDVMLRSEQPPCLVLLDMMMPIMDGREVLEAMRTSEALAAIPVAVVSASEGAPVDGAMRFFRKPVRLESLLEVVREFCCAARERRAPAR